jgi:hypothetical protein
VAFERANKAFLLSGDADILNKAEEVAQRIANAGANDSIADLERLRAEIAMFVRQGRAALAAGHAP